MRAVSLFDFEKIFKHPKQKIIMPGLTTPSLLLKKIIFRYSKNEKLKKFNEIQALKQKCESF
jgi:hypothetical protein